jgi:hypothetical protein
MIDVVDFGWNMGGALFAFLAAGFWFASARGKVPIVDLTWGGIGKTDEEIISAMKYSAKLNSIAAVSAGISASFVAADIVWKLHLILK